MNSQKTELYAALEALQGTTIAVVGDLILDKYVWGEVSRVSPEAPVPVVKVDREEYRLGGAANVVMNLSCLGVNAELCAIVGEDEEAKQAQMLLAKVGATTSRLISDASRPTSVKTRVIARKQQVVRIDSESTIPANKEISKKLSDTLLEALKESSGLIVSDYAKGAITPELMTTLSEAKAKKLIDLKNKPVLLDPRMSDFDFYKGVNVIKPNRREAELHSGIKISSREDAEKAGKILLDKWDAELAIITLGSLGMVVLEKGSKASVNLDTLARDVYDVSGAGDTVASVFASALASGATPTVAGDLANLAAGVVVSEVGTYAIEQERLKQEIERVFLLQE